MQQLNRRGAGWTLIWFVVFAVFWQLAPVPEAWKILPDVRDTFLAKGLKGTRNMAGPPEFSGLSPLPVVAPIETACAGPASAPSSEQSDPQLSPQSIVLASARGAASASVASASPLPHTPEPNAGARAMERSQPIEQGCVHEAADGCAELALEPFFRMLARTARREPGAITRISHFGDSIIASDYISATVRRRLQREWGDAGHGFVLAAKPWRWYDHRGVTHQASVDWLIHGIVTRRFTDSRFGIGGVAFETRSGGLTADYGTARSGSTGRAVSRFDLYYEEQPEGGSLELLVNGQLRHRLATRGVETRSAYHEIEVPDGAATLTVRTVGDGAVRLYGVTLERTTPGVVYDSIGIVGGSVGALRRIDSQHWLEQLRHRAPNLIVFSFGANESLTYARAGSRVMREYELSQASLIRQVRAALPQTSVLVMGPLDAAERSEGMVITRPSIPKMVAAQRRAALSSGAAFWNTFEAMGGEGSMARWVELRLGSSDLVHPSWSGAVKLGNELARSLMVSYHLYEHEQANKRMAVPLAARRLKSTVPAPP